MSAVFFRFGVRVGFLLIPLGLLLPGAAARAQTVINTPITVPLETVTVGTGDSSYEKLGIWASIGGGTPQLFEFDTGGDGFYAVYSAGVTPWWGGAATVTTQPFTQMYSSGLTYTGFYATGAVSIFDSQTATTPLIQTVTNVTIGQTDAITDSPVPWPPVTSPPPPPVDYTFFGDFGASLVNKGEVSGVQTPVNLFAQLTYGPGVDAGFIVHSGPHGSTSGAYVQVGITPAEMATFPIQFPMAQPDASPSPTPTPPPPFPNGGLTSHGLSLFKGTLLLQPTPAPGAPAPVTLTDTPITVDTGNQTPVIYTANNDVPADFQQSFNTNTMVLIPGIGLSLTASPAGATDLALYAVTAGLVEGVDKVVVGASQHNTLSFNVGLPIFEQYDIAFDLTTSTIALRPLATPTPTPTPAPAPLPLAVKVQGKPERTVTQNRVQLTGTASGTGLSAVRLEINGHPKRANGTGKWKLTIVLKPGRNVVKVYALSAAGQSSEAAKVVIIYHQKP